MDRRPPREFVRVVRHVVLAFGLAMYAPVTPALAQLHTVYVDRSSSNASDTGPGTLAAPFRTIRAAIKSQGQPGSTILVAPGVYPETVELTTSGTSDSTRVVLQAEGPGTVVTGADAFDDPAQWQPLDDATYVARAVTWAPVQVFLDGARIAPSTADTLALPPNSFRWVAGAGLFVRAGGNPALRNCQVGRRTNAFIVTGAYVSIVGFTATASEDRAIVLEYPAHHDEVRGCTVNLAGRQGIAADSSLAATIRNNVVSDNADHGIYVVHGSGGSTITDNESFRNARPNERAANGINVDGSPSCTVARNRCHDNQDSGFQFYNGSNNVLSFENLSWNNGDHGFDHVRTTGVRHLNEVAWGNWKDGFSFEGNASGGSVYDCIAVDNGLSTGEFDLWVDASSATGFVSDYNLFWNSVAKPPLKMSSTKYATLAAWTAANGQDAHSRQADPRFVSAAAGDFHLDPGSPAIDAADAAVTGWPALDAAGEMRQDDPATLDSGIGMLPFTDMGAYEYAPRAYAEFCENGDFERDSAGWASNGAAVLQRVHPGRSGAWALRVIAPSNTTFGITDEPSWVAQVAAPGTEYVIHCWVRSDSSAGLAKIKVREMVDGQRVGPSYYSEPVPLTPGWQFLRYDFVARTRGAMLDIEINDYPVAAGESFEIDDVHVVVPGNSGSFTLSRIEAGDAAAARVKPRAAAPRVELSSSPLARDGALEVVLPAAARASLAVYDAAGRRIAAPLDGASLAAGVHRVSVAEALGGRPRPGAYFYRFTSGATVAGGRFVVLE